MGTWADSFLPAITGELAQVGPAMQQGQLQGMNAARQLALLDMQLKAQQMQNQQAERAMQQPQWKSYQPGTFMQQVSPTGQILQSRTIPDPYRQSQSEVSQIRAQIAQQQADTAVKRAEQVGAYQKDLLGIRSDLQTQRE